MTIGSDRGPGVVDSARWLRGFESLVAVELPTALDEIAQRVHDLLPVDLVAVHVVDEIDPEGIAHGYCVGPSPAAQAIAPLLTPGGIDPIGLGDAAREAGHPVVWQRLVSEPAELARLAMLADAGGQAGALHRLLLDAGGLAVPFGTRNHPGLGAVAVVSLSRDSPIPERAIEALEELSPQIALTARNHQLVARNRHNRQTLEGVLSSSRMGVIVSDVRGRLSLTNRAAEEILGVDLKALVGQPMRTVLDERIKWRFINPEQYAERFLAIHRDPTREAIGDAETVDGRAVEHSSSPVRDPAGGLVGRVDILHDVTPARAALADAQRLAAERAELLEREERRAHEEMGLTHAAHLMASALTPTDIGELLLEHAHGLLPRCEKSVVLITDRRGRVRPIAARGFAPETLAKMDFRSGEGVVGRAMADRRHFICNDTEVDGRISARLTVPEEIRSFIHIPLVSGDRVLGLVSVASPQPRAFGERDLKVVNELTRHAASAMSNALQFERERHIAETLQQALIADRLPEVPGLELAALYQAAAGSEVGGDFYSAWPLPDGRLALLVGDVSGKGVEAAGVTAMVRHMAEALSQRCTDPAELVSELNELLCPRMADGSLVTLVLAMVDIDRGELRCCVAGHPPPVIMSPAGDYRRLDDPDPPCGIFPGQRFRSRTEPFAPDDLLVLYTDGLIEARRDGREFGEDGLRDALAAEGCASPAQLARSAYAAVRAWSGGRLTDDVAIAVVKRVPLERPA